MHNYLGLKDVTSTDLNDSASETSRDGKADSPINDDETEDSFQQREPMTYSQKYFKKLAKN